MSDVARELASRLGESAPDPAAICGLLDAADPARRLEAARSLGRAQQRALYHAVDGFLPLELADLVAPSVGDLQEVRHHGRNTLPAFSLFEKRFCRPAGEDRAKPTQLYGYNHQRMAAVTGPGCFVAVPHPQRPEVCVDYTRLPDATPPGWPEPRSNERGLSRFVYGFMVDTLRRVSEHVSIGSAARRGRDLGSWFVLVRED